MILDRFSKAIVKQNWDTVVLEILVLVVGVVLGLQVDDWNERRKFRQQELVYIEKLRDDLKVMQADLGDLVERTEESHRRMSAALFALEDCDNSEQAQDDVNFAFVRYQALRPFNYLGATYDEMVSSGALARLSNQAVKQKIANSFSRLADVNANQRSFRVSMPVVDAIIWDAVSFSVNRQSGQPLALFDIDSLCRDVRIRNAIVEMIDIQWDSMSGAKRALDSVDNLVPDLDVETIMRIR